MPAIRPTNAPVPVARLRADREHEDAEDRAVEERPEAVDDLDERAEVGREDRDDAGEDAPEAGRDLRHRQVVRVGRLGPQVPPVEVDDASPSPASSARRRSLDIAAAKIAAMMSPTSPSGSCVVTNVGKT